MPDIVGANTHLSTIVIGERIAALMREDNVIMASKSAHQEVAVQAAKL